MARASFRGWFDDWCDALLKAEAALSEEIVAIFVAVGSKRRSLMQVLP
jgi:hypothetical protein